MEEIKKAIDEVIFAVGKLNETIAQHELYGNEHIMKSLVVNMTPEQLLQLLIDWRISLDSFE